MSMRKRYFLYKNVWFNSGDVKLLIRCCLAAVLGFSPSCSSITHIYSYSADDVQTINFKINCISYILDVYSDYYACLTLISDQFGGSDPSLGFIPSYVLRDLLDDIVQTRLNNKGGVKYE